MGVKFFDYDNDGRLDLFVTDMHSDMSEEAGPDGEKAKSHMTWPESYLQGGANNIWGNAAYHNLGGGKFEEISDRLGFENYWPWGFSVGDVNADGWDDVFITSGMGFPFRYGINSMLLNDRGQNSTTRSSCSGSSRGATAGRIPHCAIWTARRKARTAPPARVGRERSRWSVPSPAALP
jgi:hypothetical protein